MTRQDRLAFPSVVYFIQSGADGPIKIGYARDTNMRLSNLQAGNPIALRYLGDIPGGRDIEAALHARFAHLRIRGEWFKAAPELTDYIREALQAAVPARRVALKRAAAGTAWRDTTGVIKTSPAFP